MKKVVVTGATSMIGIALINECIKNNVEVLAIVRVGSKRIDRLPKSPLITILEANLSDYSNVNILSDDYDVFYHFAWEYTSKEDRNNPILQEKNIEYTLAAVTLAKRLNCSTFVGAGSQAEFGYTKEVITSATIANPQSAYGIAKYSARKLSKLWCMQLGLVHIWGCIFSVYGKNDNDGTMIRYAFEQYKKGEIAFFTSGTQMWNYLFEEDAGRIFYYIGEKCKQSKVYCIANHKSKPLKEYLSDMRLVLGDSFNYQLDALPNQQVVSLNPDTKELNEDIDYYPQTDFSTGIAYLRDYGYKG